VPRFEFQANAVSSYYFAARRSYRSPGPGQELSLCEIAAKLVITRGKKGQHPSPATVMRLLREFDEASVAAAVPANG
jgi:hypothetical protein